MDPSSLFEFAQVTTTHFETTISVHLLCSAPVTEIVAEPLVGEATMPPVSISQVVRKRLSNVLFNDRPLPKVAFIKPPKGAYAADKDCTHGVLVAVCAEKSWDGCVASLQLLVSVNSRPAESNVFVKSVIPSVKV